MKEYVSRDYLLGEYDRQHQGPPGGARKIIAEAPAADVVEVRHGRWEPVKGYTGVEAFGFREETVVALRCSVCDGEIDPSEGWAKYCPNCGAVMDGGQDE